jgi:hypothetical protein
MIWDSDDVMRLSHTFPSYRFQTLSAKPQSPHPSRKDTRARGMGFGLWVSGFGVPQALAIRRSATCLASL